MSTRMQQVGRGLARIALSAALVGVAGLAGCRGDREDKPPRQFFPDMDHSPKYKPQAENPFYSDGRAMRPTVAGTVPFGRWDFDPAAMGGEDWAEPLLAERASLLAEDDAVYRGRLADGTYVDRIPVPVTPTLLARGEERFNIYCAACHGYQGNGLGMVGQRWSAPIPSFHDPKYYLGSGDPDGRGTDGFFFFIGMNGVAGPDGYPLPTDDQATRMRKKAALKMPSYAHAVGAQDMWAIVAYIRALQEHTSPGDVPEGERRRLEQERAGLAQAAGGTAPGATGGGEAKP